MCRVVWVDMDFVVVGVVVVVLVRDERDKE